MKKCHFSLFKNGKYRKCPALLKSAVKTANRAQPWRGLALEGAAWSSRCWWSWTSCGRARRSPSGGPSAPCWAPSSPTLCLGTRRDIPEPTASIFNPLVPTQSLPRVQKIKIRKLATVCWQICSLAGFHSYLLSNSSNSLLESPWISIRGESYLNLRAS